MEKEADSFIEYEVQASDTLNGIVLDFGVSKAYLKKINKLFGDEIIHLKTLKLPNSKQVREKLAKLNVDCKKKELNEKERINLFVDLMKREYNLDGETIHDFYKLYRGIFYIFLKAKGIKKSLKENVVF